MKREIKFRAWDKAKHRMLGVDQLAFGPNGELESIYCDGPDFSNDPDALMGEEPDLNDAELMQYTGLHDKNGREIYENDVVRYTAWHDGKPTGSFQGEVVYSGDLGMASFDIRLDHDGEIDRAVLPARGVEIMGNVYENPELMEASK